MLLRILFYTLALACAGLVFGLALLPLSAEGTKGKKYALLVGVKEYDSRHLRALSYTENDVNEMAKELKKAGYIVVLLTTADEKNKPTLANIEKQLEALLAKATRRDMILVGLAGHGLQFDKKEDSYFCPVDAKINDTKTLLSMRSVYKKLEEGEAGIGLLLVDACRDDGGPRAARKRGIDGDKLPSPPKGVAALFSCSSGQFAWETPKYKHGVFFHFVLEGLRGKAKDEEGEVTWARLSEYVSKRVAKTVPDLIGGGAQQEPHEMKSLAGISPVLLDATREEIVKDLPKEIKNSIGMKLVYIKPGKFQMGSPKEEQDDVIADYEKWLKKKPPQLLLDLWQSEGPVHEVKITRGFYVGVYEVTQGEYMAVMGTNPSYFSAKGAGKDKVIGDTRRFPVETVSYEDKPQFPPLPKIAIHPVPVETVAYEDALEFCKKLSAKEAGKGRVYRLPTEAEWEYACRAGTKTPFHYGKLLSSNQANFNGNYPYGGAAKSTFLERTCEVGSYKPNAWGLYDMHGNVWEWCSDWYAKDYYGEEGNSDPKGPNKGICRVLRGGSWNFGGRDSRSAYRYKLTPGDRVNGIGFRVVCGSP